MLRGFTTNIHSFRTLEIGYYKSQDFNYQRSMMEFGLQKGVSEDDKRKEIIRRKLEIFKVSAYTNDLKVFVSQQCFKLIMRDVQY